MDKFESLSEDNFLNWKLLEILILIKTNSRHGISIREKIEEYIHSTRSEACVVSVCLDNERCDVVEETTVDFDSS